MWPPFAPALIFPPALPRKLRLTADRVYLRPPRRGDYQAWAELRGQSRGFLEPWDPTWPPDALTRAAYARRLRFAAEDWRDGRGFAFHILSADGADCLLGGISLTQVRRGVAQMGTIGYWIGQPHARQGYMTEALIALCGFAFGDLGLHRVEAACLPRNAASQALLRRVGFRQEGLAQRYLKIAGVWEDHLLFGLTVEEWGDGHRPPA